MDREALRQLLGNLVDLALDTRLTLEEEMIAITRDPFWTGRNPLWTGRHQRAFTSARAAVALSIPSDELVEHICAMVYLVDATVAALEDVAPALKEVGYWNAHQRNTFDRARNVAAS